MEDFLNIAVQAVWIAFSIALVPLVAALVVTLVFSVFQTMTQVRDESLSGIPRNIAIILVVLITLPWMVSTVSSFASTLFEMMLRVGN